MKNLIILIITLSVSNIILAQSDTSFVTYHNYNFGHPSNEHTEYTQVHVLSDSTLIFIGQYIKSNMTMPLISLQDYNFNYINADYPDVFTYYRNWEQPSFRSYIDTTGIFLCMFNDADSSLNINHYDQELNLISNAHVTLSQYPLLVINDFKIKDSLFHVSGFFNDKDDDHEALYLKLNFEGLVLNEIRGSDIFNASNNEFWKMIIKDDYSYIYYKGIWPEFETNKGIIRISNDQHVSLVYDWDFPSPFQFSFHFLDSTEYIYNARNNSLPQPNWFAQYYENLNEEVSWEAIDNAAAYFTSVTITNFTENKNKNLLAYGIKENFFNPDSVEFPDLSNVINYAAAYITELDRETGQREWEYMYLHYNKEGEIDNSIIYDVVELPDSSLVAVGRSELDNVGDDVAPRIYAAMILKLPANGCFNNDCEDLLSFTSATKELPEIDFEQSQLSVFPNPGSEQITISDFNGENLNDLKYSLWTLDGGKVVNTKLAINKSGTINISSLNQGAYFIRVVDSAKKKTYVAKFVKM